MYKLRMSEVYIATIAFAVSNSELVLQLLPETKPLQRGVAVRGCTVFWQLTRSNPLDAPNQCDWSINLTRCLR